MRIPPTGLILRKYRAGWRDTLLLLREFSQPLFIFALTIAGSGTIYYLLSLGTSDQLGNLAESMYVTLSLTFLQSPVSFPHIWYLQIFFFLLPVIGLIIVAQGLTDFGILLFNRRLRGKKWEIAVASTLSNHVVLIGLGHLGYRVVRQLVDLHQEVAVIEAKPRADLVEDVRALGVPVIEEDGTREAVLVSAGVPRARVIMLCTQDDSLNLQMALKARNLNPNIEVVIRIFDDEFAASLQSQFKFHAVSATGMAAPLFAAQAAEVDITPPISIEGLPHILARMRVSPHSHLSDRTVGQVEEKFRVSIVLLIQDGKQNFHPPGDVIICPEQILAVFGEPDHIKNLLNDNRR